MRSEQRLSEIRRRLRNTLAPVRLEITDESDKHAGHPGAADGRGHFKVLIRSQELAEMTPLARHRRIYEALGDLMLTDIHAISLDARAPDDDELKSERQPDHDSH